MLLSSSSYGQLFTSWGSYRGDRIGIFTYNLEKEKGFVDIDYFKYAISE
jgi:hypothetical protein